MDSNDLDNRFKYHPPKDAETQYAHEQVRDNCLALAVNVIDRFCPESREKSLAITKLEEVMMWANAAIARNPVPEQESK